MDEAKVLVLNNIRLDHGDVWLKQGPELLVCRAISHIANKQFLCGLASSVVSSDTGGHFYLHSSSLDISAVQSFYGLGRVFLRIHVDEAKGERFFHEHLFK